MAGAFYKYKVETFFKAVGPHRCFICKKRLDNIVYSVYNMFMTVKEIINKLKDDGWYEVTKAWVA